ncbi:GDP dissociation inhibitor-domain-containing protein [Gautieria morchelliformis]|nr:GDP dissociation inhibitor-domain-containing protein [Gautieria morchelliformis]
MDTHFDVLVLGTGLTQSITAAALAKAGFKVAHVDQNAYYGADEASLAQDELLEWSRRPSARYFDFTASSSESPLPFARSYALSLAPALIPSSGPVINALILSGVSRYGQFRLLDAVFAFTARRGAGALERVPATKADIFKAHDIALVDKRKLMRFLQFAAGDSDFEDRAEVEGQRDRPFGDFLRDKFGLGVEAREAILYALAYCASASEPTLSALKRLRRFLRSAGRYGSSPFLLGHYGGLGELAQGFCRTCAVNGGVYILGRKFLSLQLPSGAEAEAGRASICLQDVPDVLTADVVIASRDYLPASVLPEPNTDTAEDTAYVFCGIVIVDRPIAFPSSAQASAETPSHAHEAPVDDVGNAAPDPDEAQLDTAVVTFAPGSLPEGKAPHVVRVLQMGEGTLSCPKGKYILYLWTQADSVSGTGTSEELLAPYLSAVTSRPSPEVDPQARCVDFSLFYTRRGGLKVSSPTCPRTLAVPGLTCAWTEIADQSAEDAEKLFWDAVKMLGHGEDGEIETFWPAAETPDETSGDEW